MTTDARSAASSHRGGRAFTPGPRLVYLGAALIAIAVAAVVVVVISSGGSAHVTAGPGLRVATKYGQDKKWIKIPTMTTPAPGIASAAKPDLSAMEGYPVTAQLSSASAKIFAAGPEVPSWVSSEASTGQLKSGQAVPATFTVSFSDTHGTVPVSADDFTVITYRGVILHPKVKVLGGGALPASLPAGKLLTLQLTTAVPEGDGAIRWAPNGKNILVSYFWTLEFD